jgi:hypothetical protein
MLIDLDQQATQAAFGELVGIAQPSVSALMAEGKLPGAGTLRELLLLLPAPARAQAAGRMGENTTLDLVQERAALAREQREGQAIKNAVARREYAPIGLLSDAVWPAAPWWIASTNWRARCARPAPTCPTRPRPPFSK